MRLPLGVGVGMGIDVGQGLDLTLLGFYWTQWVPLEPV